MATKLNLNNQNILLIGFSGVGKSKTSRVLAKKLDTYYLDTDDLIETYEDRKIKDIFEINGEDYFRKLEEDVSIHIRQNITNTVIACGGGLPIFFKDIQALGIVIYLKASFDEIVKAIPQSELDKRVIYKDMTKAKEIFLYRSEIYKQNADYVIQASSFEVNCISILAYLKNKVL